MSDICETTPALIPGKPTLNIATEITFSDSLKTAQAALKSIDRLFLLPERTADSAAVVNYIACGLEGSSA